MIRRFSVPEELIESVREYLKEYNLGKRGNFDGNSRNQEIGLLGECICFYYFFKSLPNLYEKKDFDGGFDIVYNGKKIDVKTMERKTYVRADYVNNFLLLQEKYPSDILLFCSYQNKENIVEICGWLPKSEVKTKGKMYPAGTERTRHDGSKFILKTDIYEVEMKDLYDVETI